MNVTEIAFVVGYNSLGTFTSRFTRSIGLSPTRFRTLSHSGLSLPPSAETGERHRSGTVHGTVELPPRSTPLRVYIGAFGGPIAEGMPASLYLLDSPIDGSRTHEFRLSLVPIGEWYVRAAAVAVHFVDVDPRPWAPQPLFVGAGRPVLMRTGHDVELRLPMRAANRTDLPILLALPELDNRHLPGQMLTTQLSSELARR